jgi:hypothetical protein
MPDEAISTTTVAAPEQKFSRSLLTDFVTPDPECCGVTLEGSKFP